MSDAVPATPKRPALMMAVPSGTPSFVMQARAEAEAMAAATGDRIEWVTLTSAIEDPVERLDAGSPFTFSDSALMSAAVRAYNASVTGASDHS